MRYIVIKEHKSNYPNPITVKKGTELKIGEKYTGPEGWENWIYCWVPEHGTEGWVPGQFISIESAEQGVILQDYTAKELNIAEGELVDGTKELNGWIWCMKVSDGEEGWLPKENLMVKA